MSVMEPRNFARDTAYLHPQYEHSDNGCVDEGRRRAIINIATKAYTDFYDNHTELLPPVLTELLKYNKNVKDKTEVRYYFVTLNFPSDIEKDALEKAFQKWENRNFVEILDCALEVQDVEGKPTHPHIHCLVNKTKRISHYLRDTYNTFKHVIPNRAAIDIKAITEKSRENVVKYIHKLDTNPITT